MSKRKGISAEEKREKLLDLFHSTKDVYTLKELEKISQKRLGISPMIIKDVLQQILDENWVEFDKVGANTVYWSFPSQASQQKRIKIEGLEKDKKGLEDRIEQERALIEKAGLGKDSSSERTDVLADVVRLKAENEAMSATLATHSKNDPAAFKNLNEELEIAKEAANRWTDNVWELKKYCQNKMSLEGKDFDKMTQENVGEVFEDYIDG